MVPLGLGVRPRESPQRRRLGDTACLTVAASRAKRKACRPADSF